MKGFFWDLFIPLVFACMAGVLLSAEFTPDGKSEFAVYLGIVLALYSLIYVIYWKDKQ